MSVNLKQIANEAGVSVPSVSRVLSGGPGFSEATRKRVLEVAERLKYRPNMLVKAMQTGRTGAIGVMIPPLDQFLSSILLGVHEVLAHRDYVPMLLWAQSDLPELEQIHRLIDRRVDGVILFPTEDSAPDNYLSEVWERGLPLVTVDRRMPHTHADFSGTDDIAGAELAAQHLLSLGHRNFIHLSACPSISTSKDRWQAFRDCIEAVEGTTVRRVVAKDFRSGYQPALEFLQAPDRPTAVFAGNDLLAVSVIQAARDVGISVPGSLSVVGYSDLTEARSVTPSLTTLRQNPQQLGRTAAQLIFDRLEERISSSSSAVLLNRPELIVRGSTSKKA